MNTITRTMPNSLYLPLIGGLVLLAGVVALMALPLDRTAAPARLPAVPGAQAESKSAVRNAEELSTFTQAREQGYRVGVASQPLFTEVREASGYAPLIANQHVSLFTQAREGSGYSAPPIVNRGLSLFTQAREQGSGENTTDTSLFTRAREG